MTPVGNQRRELIFIAGALFPIWYETQMKVLKKRKEKKKAGVMKRFWNLMYDTHRKKRKNRETFANTPPPRGLPILIPGATQQSGATESKMAALSNLSPTFMSNYQSFG